MSEAPGPPPTRGQRKREKTRAQLVQAGLRAVARKGDGLTVSDVVGEADVSTGTFYNYFVDRDELFEALAEHVALSIAEAAAREPITDPARRFAVATGRILQRAIEDPTWARAVLRLVSRPDSGVEIRRHLSEDLAEGQKQGRFDYGPDDTTLDQVGGMIIMTIRRIASGDANAETIERAIARELESLGVAASEANEIAAEALRAADATSDQPR